MTVRLAVAGAGLIGQRHVEEIDPSPSATLAAIVDPFPAAAEVAAKFSVPLFGDSEHTPNPSLAPLEKGPFLRDLPGSFGSFSLAAGGYGRVCVGFRRRCADQMHPPRWMR